MHVISKRTLREHWEKPNREDSEQPLKSWHQVASTATWTTPSDVRATYGTASFVGERTVFNIAGNKYRLVTWIDYDRQVVFVKFVGTHAEYDKIDVQTINKPET